MKGVNLIRVIKLLENIINDNSYPESDRLELRKFVDKISRSKEFVEVINKEFSSFKLKYRKDQIIENLKNKDLIDFDCGYELRRLGVASWQLFHHGNLIKDNLTTSEALNFGLDINTLL